jgi:DNA primase
MIGLCPFHNEKTPSFTVSPSKNIYKCFGCGQAGNGVQFLMEHEGMSFPDAIRHLANKYGIELEETQSSNFDQETQLERDSLYIINDFAKDTFITNLFDSKEGKQIGLPYFKERGYRENTIKRFELGFALRQRDYLTKLALEKGYKKESMQKLGLTSQKDFDFFRDRVMFPIHNLSGKVIAFGGRTLSTDKKIPKYINSPETDIYNKSNSVYGIYQAKTDIRRQDNCILVEGYTDVISLSQAGIENVISSSGTSLTEGQIRIVKRFTSNITILYDGDAAGVKAALRGIDLILEQDMNVHIVLLPENDDPDSFVKAKGSNGLQTYIEENKKDFIFFKTDVLMKEAGDDPIKKTGVIKSIVSSIAHIPDSLKRALYIRECGNLLDLSEEILVAETNKIIRAKFKREQRQSNFTRRDEDSFVRPKPTKSNDQKKPSYAGDDYQERDLVRILLNLGHQQYDENTTVAEYMIFNIKDLMDSFSNDLYKSIFLESAELIETDGKFSPNYFVNHNIEDVRLACIDLMQDQYEYANWENQGLYLQTQKEPDKNHEEDSKQAILRFKERKLRKNMKEISERLNDKNIDDEMKTLLITAQISYKSTLNEIHKELGTVVPSKM